MTKQWLKFIKKLERKKQNEILNSVKNIVTGNLHGLDIKIMKGYKNKFRCRIGKFHIVFDKNLNNKYFIKKIGNRGEIYRKK